MFAHAGIVVLSITALLSSSVQAYCQPPDPCQRWPYANLAPLKQYEPAQSWCRAKFPKAACVTTTVATASSTSTSTTTVTDATTTISTQPFDTSTVFTSTATVTTADATVTETSYTSTSTSTIFTSITTSTVTERTTSITVTTSTDTSTSTVLSGTTTIPTTSAVLINNIQKRALVDRDAVEERAPHNKDVQAHISRLVSLKGCALDVAKTACSCITTTQPCSTSTTTTTSQFSTVVTARATATSTVRGTTTVSTGTIQTVRIPTTTSTITTVSTKIDSGVTTTTTTTTKTDTSTSVTRTTSITTVTSPAVTLRPVSVISYLRRYGPENGTAYSLVSLLDQTSNDDPANTGSYQAIQQFCGNYCARNPRCVSFGSNYFPPCAPNGAALYCIITTDSYSPNKLQRGIGTGFDGCPIYQEGTVYERAL